MTRISEAIKCIRFPLIVVVVMIHIFQDADKLAVHGHSLTVGYPEWFYTFMYFMAEGIGRVAVPVFFAISGYLFFYRVRDFTPELYKSKLSKRVKSLLVPYLIWNTLFIGLFFLKGVPPLSSFYPSAANFQISTYWLLNSYIGLDGYPLLYPLWYVRDLMIIVLISPIVYYFVRKIKYVYMAILGVLTIVGGANNWRKPVS